MMSLLPNNVTLFFVGIGVRVLDPFTIKPLDKDAIIRNAKECGGNIVVAEDHYPEGNDKLS